MPLIQDDIARVNTIKIGIHDQIIIDHRGKVRRKSKTISWSATETFEMAIINPRAAARLVFDK